LGPIVRIFKDLHIAANIELAKASLKGLSGIYCFRHIASRGKENIPRADRQAVNISVRLMDHIKGRESNIILQRAQVRGFWKHLNLLLLNLLRILLY